MIDNSFQLLACRYLHKQLEKMQKELAGARIADDIEYVHQSRVASRRMRAGLSFFEKCFSPKKTKKWQGQIRKVTKKLGLARDRDVQIEFIKEFLSNLDEGQKQYKRGVKRLLLRLQQSRRQLQPKVVNSVDKFYSSGVLADMHGEIEKVLFGSRGRDISLQSDFVFRQSGQRIRQHLSQLLSDQDALTNPLDKDGHHRMRISAKKLRYTLEICDIPFNGELKEMTRAVKKTQTHLGDIHDCDLWHEYLEQFIVEEKHKTLEYFGHTRSFTAIRKGIEFLNGECSKKRDALFSEFVGYWNGISQEGLWDKLQAVIDAPLREYQESSEMNLTA
jgi:CHAD domain-containing protein